MSKLDRRELLRQGAAAAAMLAVAEPLSILNWTAAVAEGPDMPPIVDTHQHLWDSERFNLPWLADAPDVLQRSYLAEDYEQATRGLNIAKAVYMEVDVHPSQQVAEAEYVLELCRGGRHPTVGAVVSGRPNSDAFRDYILRFKDNSYIKGVRQVLHVSAKPGLCLEPQFVKSVQLLGELGKSFDLCMRPTELGDGVKLADQCPDTRLIVDHCGNADPKAFLPAGSGDPEPAHTVDQWKRDMAALAKRPGVICKISGIVARAPAGWRAEHLAPIIDFCWDTFGPDRVVFGGDWPVCLLGATFAEWLAALKQIISGRSQADQRKLLHDNAVKFYGLS